MRYAILALADGTCFTGQCYGYRKTAVGELVFNTAMVGYQEILTDPSYAGQIITFTYPHLGNTGINTEDKESTRIHAAAMVCREPSPMVSNHRANISLEQFLHQQKCTAITHIDTRRLARLLRDKGCQNACIMSYENEKDTLKISKQAREQAASFPPLKSRHWANEVSRTDVQQWRNGIWRPKYEQQRSKRKSTSSRIVVYDCGVKHNILRLLHEQKCQVFCVPLLTKAADVIAKYRPDGILISNGPGDPDACGQTVKDIQYFLARKIPLFGICLGHQLLGMACQLETYKMKYGHHGANHPVKDLITGKVLISSQNHNFAISESSLQKHIRITHRSLFDNSIQGIELLDRPAFSFQGHPEASPGPHDLNYLFTKFAKMVTHA